MFPKQSNYIGCLAFDLLCNCLGGPLKAWRPCSTAMHKVFPNEQHSCLAVLPLYVKLNTLGASQVSH